MLDGKLSSFVAGAPTNIGTPARLAIYRVSDADGTRQGDAVHQRQTGADGRWGPFIADAGARYEFVLEIADQPITHVYRSPFPRSTSILHVRPQPLAKGDAESASVVYLQRPRGYFGAGRDVIELGGKPAAGIPDGVPSVSTAKVLLPDGAPQTVVGRFNTESIAARSWPMADKHIAVIELTY